MANTQHYTQTDTVGGCTIRGFAGEELTINDGNLYALDILEAPALKVIKIERLHAGKPPHLTLENVPNLERIELPASHRGAVIHLNSKQAPEPLTIEGLVSEIDGAWPGVQFRQKASSHRKSWVRVSVRHTAQALTSHQDAELVIMTGPAPAGVEHLTLNGHSDWLLADIDGVNHLQIGTSGRVAVDQMPTLRTVFSSAHKLILSLCRTPRLRRVAGCGELISVRQSAWEEKRLVIAENWKNAKIASDRLEELSFINGQALILYHCSRLKVAELPLGMDIVCHGALPAPLAGSARFFYDEATLAHNIHALRQGDQSVLPVVFRVLGGAHEPSQVVHCLQQLATLCELGIEPARIWSCRRELAARHKNARSRRKTKGLRPLNEAAMAKADLFWHWHLPDDLAQQGWEADLAIWAYCHHFVPSAADYTEIMALTCRDETAVDVVIRKAGNFDDGPALQNLALRVMEEYLAKNADFMLQRHRRSGNNPTMRLMRILIRPTTTDQQRQTIIAFLCNILPLHRLLESIPPVVHMAPGLFRSQLMALSRKPEHWFNARFDWLTFSQRRHALDKYRGKLMAIALAPACSEDEDEDQPQAGQNYSLFQEG